MNKNELQKISNIISSYKSFAIYGHMKTDFDSIGSCLSLKRVLENMGKTAHVFMDSELLPNGKIFLDYGKINNEKAPAYDVAVVLDCNDESRLGRLRYKYRKNVKTTIEIDHHLGNEGFARANYIVEGESSTCELMCNLYEYMKVKLDKETAKLLLTGIYTDTGCFKFSNTHSSTYMWASKLIKIADISIDEMTNPIFRSMTIPGFNLTKLAYNNTKFFEDGKVAIICLSAEDFESVGATFEETKGIVEVAMQLESVKIMALVSENPLERGVQYISIRSKAPYSSCNVAMQFGGGGHEQAAGCRVNDDQKAASEKIVKYMIEESKRC